jgi:DNA-binding MarR family transcriptional regulator
MRRRVSLEEYRALAEIRFLIRRYLQNSEEAVRAVGLEPQQYMSMLQLRGLPAGQQPTIQALAERMQLRHHSVVELVNRMEKGELLQRQRAKKDRRFVLVRMTPKAENLLDKLVRRRIAELRATGHDLVRSLGVVVGVVPLGKQVAPRGHRNQPAKPQPHR